MTTAAGEGQAQRDSRTPGVQRQPHRGPAGADEARLLLGEGRQAPKERRMERKTEQGLRAWGGARPPAREHHYAGSWRGGGAALHPDADADCVLRTAVRNHGPVSTYVT